MFWLATTILALAPQGTTVRDKEGRLILPPQRKPAVASPDPQQGKRPVIRDADQRRFHARAMDLRRSRFLSAVSEQEAIRQVGLEFEDAAVRALRLGRSANSDLLHGVVRILDAYGSPAEAKELGFLLQTRPFGKATRGAVATMARIGRDEGRELLFGLLNVKRDAVRRCAADELSARVLPEDLPRLINLLNQSDAPMRARAARLMGSLRDPRAVTALLEGLRDKPTVAEAACAALVKQGDLAVEPLQAILKRPAVGRAFGFAAFALAKIEADSLRPLLDESMREPLLAELDMPDRFMQSAVAIALSGLAWNSSDTTGSHYNDRKVVERLVSVVAPVEFVPHVALLQDLARDRLIMFSGKDFGLRHGRWRDWWADVDVGTTYVAARRRLEVDASNAALTSLIWRSSKLAVRLRGESLDPLPAADLREVAGGEERATFEYILPADEMVQVVKQLEGVGFMRPSRERAVQASGKSLALAVGGARCQTDPLLEERAIRALHDVVTKVTEPRAWQLYRDLAAEPDVTAFWRAERKWLDAHPDPAERANRLVGRVLGRMPDLKGTALDLAFQHLASVPNVRSLIDGERAREILAVLAARPEWDERSGFLADFVLAAGDDAPWSELLKVAQERAGAERAPVVLSSVFHLLGPDRVLEAIQRQDVERGVRIAAIDEATKLKDLRAVPILIELLEDREPSVTSSATFALGQLRAAKARDPLIDLLANGGQTLAPTLRRTVWIALARIGGAEVFPILNAAFYSPDASDRRAVLQAFAELRDPGAAAELGNVLALRGPNDELGVLALQLLRGLGDELGGPALRPHVSSNNPDVLREVALALGEFGDPAALPALVRLLEDTRYSATATVLIGGITGVDLTTENQRSAYMRRWMQVHGSDDQARWLLGALAVHKVNHGLRLDALGRGAGMSQVPELARLLVEVDNAHLRPLIARMLRRVSGEDFGLVSALDSSEKLRAIADRYQIFADAEKAASTR